jgi:hypothetical protein
MRPKPASFTYSAVVSRALIRLSFLLWISIAQSQADAALPATDTSSASPSTSFTITARLSKSGASAASAGAKEEKAKPSQSSSSSEPHPASLEGRPLPPAGDIAAVLSEMEEEDEGRYDAVELEETECPLCHFMRASPCGATWVRWEKCIHFHKSKEEDFVGPCARVTLKLAECIQQHQNDFPPTLRNALLGGGDVEDGEGDEAEEKDGAKGVTEVGDKDRGEDILQSSPTSSTGGKSDRLKKNFTLHEDHEETDQSERDEHPVKSASPGVLPPSRSPNGAKEGESENGNAEKKDKEGPIKK